LSMGFTINIANWHTNIFHWVKSIAKLFGAW